MPSLGKLVQNLELAGPYVEVQEAAKATMELRGEAKVLYGCGRRGSEGLIKGIRSVQTA